MRWRRAWTFIFRNAEVCLAAGTVYEEADTYDDAARLVHDVDYFFDGTASRDDIFYDEHLFTRRMLKPRRRVILPFSRSVKMARRAESLADFMGKDDAAGHRSDNGLDAHAP